MESCLFEGRVTHRRTVPVVHGFGYQVFMVYLDLDELPDVFRGRWLWSATRPALAWFRREDHVGDHARPLDAVVRDLVQERTGRRPDGPVRLLTNLRHFGFVINPVSFYYCFDTAGRQVESIVAEVHNTPWNETHCYVLDAVATGQVDGTKVFRHPKTFHVSPFMGMNQEYAWRMTDPGRRLHVHIANIEGGQRVFDSTLTLERREITGHRLASVLARFPFMTGRILVAIHWQALRLYLRRVPFFPHPGRAAAAGAGDD